LIIIGELINSTRKDIKKAIEDEDVAYIQDIAKKQEAAGADYIDVNAGMRLHDEIEKLCWLVKIVQEVVNVPLCIDSPNPKAIDAALKIHKGQALVNSITMEKERYDELLPIIVKNNTRIIALCMDETGMPKTAEQRINVAKKLADGLLGAGIKEEDIFFDPLVKPLSVDINFGNEILDSIEALRKEYPNVNITSGLSNISFGLPNRSQINQAFMVMCMVKGMNSAIVDPLNERMMDLIVSSEACLGLDKFCMNYIKRQRAKSS
jgi:5-methyltetrahydrofolate--homocysteine methyltransferase